MYNVAVAGWACSWFAFVLEVEACRDSGLGVSCDHRRFRCVTVVTFVLPLCYRYVTVVTVVLP